MIIKLIFNNENIETIFPCDNNVVKVSKLWWQLNLQRIQTKLSVRPINSITWLLHPNWVCSKLLSKCWTTLNHRGPKCCVWWQIFCIWHQNRRMPMLYQIYVIPVKSQLCSWYHYLWNHSIFTMFRRWNYPEPHLLSLPNVF